MTIDEAITRLKQQAEYNDKYVDFAGINDAYNLAVRSLEAWEKVNSGITSLVWCGNDTYWEGVKDVSKIIKKHLNEVFDGSN